MKKNVLIFICLITVGLINASTLLAAECVKNGAGLITSRVECGTQPDEQYITINRLALCTQTPTLANPAGSKISTTGCTDLFSDANGVEVVITKAGVALPNFTDAPAGAYSFLYAEIKPDFKIKTIQRFSSAVFGSGGTTTGSICWTKTVTIHNFRTNTPAAAECGNAEPAAGAVGITTTHFNAIVGGPPGIVHITAAMNLGFRAALLNANRNLIDVAALVNGQAGDETILAAWFPVAVTSFGAGRTAYTASFPNTQGTNVNFETGAFPTRIMNFGGADIDIVMSTSQVAGTN